jgi:hypothetical protein
VTQTLSGNACIEVNSCYSLVSAEDTLGKDVSPTAATLNSSYANKFNFFVTVWYSPCVVALHITSKDIYTHTHA